MEKIPSKQQESQPKWAVRFFRWYCNDHLSEAVLGDMIELYARRKQQLGKRTTDLLFLWNVLCFLQPFAIKRKSAPQNHFAMFENYFKITWRTMSRQKMYSGIKIGGFAAGIATCLLIALFVRHELTYDRHYQNTDRLFRVYRESISNGEFRRGVYFPAPFAKALQEGFPEIELAGHYNSGEFFGAGSNEVRRADQPESLHEEGFIYADQSLIDVLEVAFIRGNPKNALIEPNSIVLTQDKAEKYFPRENPLDKILVLNNDESRQYKITGVIKSFPSTSHIQSKFLMTLSGKEFWKGENTSWRSDNYFDYVLVRPGANIFQLENKLNSIVSQYYLPDAMEGGDGKVINWVKSLRIKLQPIKDVYLNTYQIDDGQTHGDIRYLWLFAAIAIFILLIACVNFINLSTAKSANRAKEVGLRKVVGSYRSNIINQFLIESSAYSMVSFALGIGLARLLLPFFNEVMAKSILFPWNELMLILILIAGALFVGLAAGLYPAFYLSSFRPIQVLKGNVSMGSKSAFTRSALVVFQFTVSIILIVGTLVINKQMNYVLNKKVGFDKEQVILLQDTHTLGDKIQPFKNELLRLPEVTYVSATGFLPITGTKRNNNGFWINGRKGMDKVVDAQRWSVDQDYIKTMGIKLLSGRDFSDDRASDSQSMIINKTMAQEMSLKNPIGESIINGGDGKWTVIGVVDDFHFESLKENIKPLCLVLGKSSNAVLIKVNAKKMESTIQSVSNVWKKFSPNQAIRYNFLDQSYARMYDDVKRMGKAFASFAALAIVVACLGLFALSAFMVEQRRKEISVRIVLGATISNVVKLLTQNFVKLVMISFLIAAPISWYLMNGWLDDYAYKIAITWDVFAMAGVLSILIALVTVSYQSGRAALTNPAASLKSE